MKKRVCKLATQLDVGDEIRFGGLPFSITAVLPEPSFDKGPTRVEIRATLVNGSMTYMFNVPASCLIRVHN